MNVAVTDWAAVTDVVHVPTPEHVPALHPLKFDPVEAVAVSVSDVPLANEAEQVAPQLIPLTDEVTVPAPVPAFVTETVNIVGFVDAIAAVLCWPQFVPSIFAHALTVYV